MSWICSRTSLKYTVHDFAFPEEFKIDRVYDICKIIYEVDIFCYNALFYNIDEKYTINELWMNILYIKLTLIHADEDCSACMWIMEVFMKFSPYHQIGPTALVIDWRLYIFKGFKAIKSRQNLKFLKTFFPSTKHL